MWILCPLAFLHIASTTVEGYGGSWLDIPSPEAPPFQRPVDVLTDVINELGVRILQEYGETRNGGNVAFSPTGIGFVLAALYEGSAGPGNEQIAHVLGLPRDKDVTRIGLRDIHRRLRSYLSPDGFLGGLTLNKENTRLRPEYENILRFLGFDLDSPNDGTNATDSSTSSPEGTITPSSSGSCSPGETTTEASDSEATSTTSTQELESTVAETTVSSRITEDVSMTTQLTEDGTEASTRSPKEVTTVDTSPEETTTLKSDVEVAGTTDTRETSDSTTTTKAAEVSEELSSTVEVTTAQSSTVSGTTPVLTTTEPPTAAPELSSRLTEASSAMPPGAESTEPLSSTQPTTVGTMIDAPVTVTEKPDMPETTLPSAEEVPETRKPELTTLEPEETTTSVVPEPSTTTEGERTVSPDEVESNIESLESSESEPEVEGSSLSPEGSQEELTTPSDEETSTLEPDETASNEIGYETGTPISVDTTTSDLVDDVETIAIANVTSSESENLSTMENGNMDAGDATTSSPRRMKRLGRRKVRRIGIRDPVVRTLLDARSARPEVQVMASSDLANSNASGAVWINRVVEYSFTDQNADENTSTLQETQNKDNQDSEESDSSEEAEIEGQARNRGTRSPRGYFSNFPELPSFPVYPDFPGFPEETSWTRKVGGWRVPAPKNDEGSRDSSELMFLVNGEEPTLVSAATYTVVLPFAFLPTLQALALEFPLDDPRYNILLLLPTDRDGTRRLAKDLGNVGLRELRKELQPAWVRAMIPSFMLKGFVTLTPFLQRLGIRDVFEPRDADLSPMTEEVGVYARDVQQSIGVNIRNYMKPDRTHSRNGLFERAGPVSFVAEHPFLFFIIDAETGVSLITGRIEDPLNSRIL